MTGEEKTKYVTNMILEKHGQFIDSDQRLVMMTSKDFPRLPTNEQEQVLGILAKDGFIEFQSVQKFRSKSDFSDEDWIIMRNLTYTDGLSLSCYMQEAYDYREYEITLCEKMMAEKDRDAVVYEMTHSDNGSIYINGVWIYKPKNGSVVDRVLCVAAKKPNQGFTLKGKPEESGESGKPKKKKKTLRATFIQTRIPLEVLDTFFPKLTDKGIMFRPKITRADILDGEIDTKIINDYLAEKRAKK